MTAATASRAKDADRRPEVTGEPVRIPLMFSDDNLYLIGPDRTYRDGDTIYTDVTVNRTETGGYVAWGIPRPAKDYEASR
jgi:hypothetical protein